MKLERLDFFLIKLYNLEFVNESEYRFNLEII